MNIINKGLLRLALAPQGLYRRLGADPAQLAVILKTKLTLDDRTPNTMQQVGRRKSAKPTNLATLGTMFFSALLGLLYLGVFAIGTDGITRYTFYFSMFLVLLCSMLIADFTSVLLDVRDNFIILTRPVNERSFLIARLLHIFIHLTKLVLPMTLPGLIYTGIQYNWLSAAWFSIVVVLLTLFCIFLINAIYLLAMRLVTPRRFQSMVSYIQVVLAVVVYASYQLVPRLMGNFENINFRIGEHWYAVLLPPFWFGAAARVLQGTVTGYEIAGAVLGVFIPIVAIWLVVRYLAAAFIRNLSLSYATQDSGEAQTKTVDRKSSLAQRAGTLLTPAGLQRAGFLFAWRLSGRSRDFRMQVLPSIGYVIVMIALFFLRTGRRGSAAVFSFDKSFVLTLVYFGAFTLITALTQVRFSEKWKAGWVFFANPATQPGALILGGFKAMVAKFYLPLALPLLIIGTLALGVQALPNLILGIINSLLIAAAVTRFIGTQLPFANPQPTSQKTGKLLRNLLILFLGGLVGIAHYFLYEFTWLIGLCCLLSVAGLYVLLNSIRQLGWKGIERQEV